MAFPSYDAGIPYDDDMLWDGEEEEAPISIGGGSVFERPIRFVTIEDKEEEEFMLLLMTEVLINA